MSEKKKQNSKASHIKPNAKRKYTAREINDCEVKFTHAVKQLYDTNEFYYYVLRQLETKIKPEFPAMAGVGYDRTNRTINLTFNPDCIIKAVDIEAELMKSRQNGASKAEISRLQDLNQQALNDIVGIIEHECSHVSLNHIFAGYDYSKKIDHRLMNISMDLYINETCKHIGTRFDEILDEKYNGVLKNICLGPVYKYPEKYPHLFEITTASGEKQKVDPKLFSYFAKMFKGKDIAEMDHIDIYRIIKAGYEKASEEEKKQMQEMMQNLDSHEVSEEGEDQKKKPCGSCNGTGKKQKEDSENGQGESEENGEEKKDGQGSGQGQGEEEDCPKCGGTGEEQGQGNGQPQDGQGQGQGELDGSLRQSDVDKVLLDAVKDLEMDPNKDLSKAIGSLPADLLARLQNLLQTSSEFKKILDSFFASMKNNKKKKTYRKLNRRYPELAPAKTKQKRPSVLLGLDWSGSMFDDKVFEMMMYEVKMYCALCENVWLVAGDTRETFRIKLKDDRHFKRLLDSGQLDVNAGGGTVLQFIWDAGKELKVDGIVCHTDGYIGNFEDHKIETIFGIYPHGRKVEGYRCADIIPKGLLDKK